MKITADFNKIVGKIKPMHGVGQPPMLGLPGPYFHYLTEANIPYSRLHDVGGAFGGNLYVDIPNIFRDFDADENDPASYDFAFTDLLMAELVKAKCEPFFRLGVTIENYGKIRKYRILPPADYDKWARICEHIIRHYNEGWAEGFTYGIRYWEIWNEPESYDQMFEGTPEDYFRLYATTSSHLKACFGDSISVGGYASTGFMSFRADPDCDGLGGREPQNIHGDDEDFGERLLTYAHGFLKYCRQYDLPLDFFSWHGYSPEGNEMVARMAYLETMLEKYGYGDSEIILNEWNTEHIPSRRGSSMAAAKALGTMLAMQKTSMALMCYYDARLGAGEYGGLFNAETRTPYKTYYAFMSFGELYRLGNEVFTESDDKDLHVGGAVRDDEKILVLANPTSKEITVELDIVGARPLSEARVLFIDEARFYTPVGRRICEDKLVMPPASCAEVWL